MADEAVKRIIIDLIPESKPFFEVMPEYDEERQTVILDPGLVQKAFWEIIQWAEEETKNYYKEGFAEKLVEQLKLKGIEHEVIRVDSQYGIYSDKAGLIIGYGYHFGVKVGNTVYDYLTLGGMDFNLWLDDLGLTSQPKNIIDWSVVD